MGPLEVALTGLVLAALAAAAWLRRSRSRRRRVAAALEPTNRPIEAIADDVRRRSERFHALAPHTSYVRVSALRAAYDHVLGECCDSLGIAHLLAVLPPGPELDKERRRVELVLHSFGLPVRHPA
ncbi:hypothetical protein [Nocardioides sp.]|uniref:hypothetical protein n=1 Tax=Nocardioides sp. TaxID=35761 RepID=UPI001A298208|nr:hypothetical protein [Nocardioides sp.]MBJ7358144.1 hypothetical protein [Nocardioides sp.]